MKFLACIATLVLMSSAYGQESLTLGRYEIAGIPSSGLSANFKRGSRFTLQTDGVLIGLCAYLDGLGGVSGQQSYRLALYRDAGGAPGAKLADSPDRSIASGTSPDWMCDGIGYNALPAGSYWIVIHTGGTAGVVRDYGDGAANWYGANDTFSDGAANTFGSGNAGTGTLSVFAFYYSNSFLKSAGRTTIGTLPSSGMTANFKRASSFQLTQQGRLYALNAYIDGRGGGTGSQWQRYVLYRDAGGLPGEKVADGSTFGLFGGARPQWATDIVVHPVILEPGRYWIAIQTGDPAGVLRNYADGTGNWYGNADAFSDGASSSFGSGNTGNGTLSANILYEPGPIAIKQFGRTDVAVTPSKGLTANMMRGSQFIANNTRGVVSSLHAYLDGLGGAQGSQKIRLSLYQLDPGNSTGNRSTATRIATTEEITIAAGTPGRWYDLPVLPIHLDRGPIPVYYIMIESGNTGGVVRNYGNKRDTTLNWTGAPISYAAGGPASFDLNAPGVTIGDVTVSVYATYSEPPR